MPKAVACGGWQWTTDFTSGRSFMIARCSRISLVRFRRPESWLPSMSTMHRSSGFMKPLQICVGVQTTSFSLDAIADVAVVGRGEALLVDPVADFADLLLDFVKVEHR